MTSSEQLKYLEDFLTPRRKMLFDQVLHQRTNFINLATQDVYQLHNTSAVIRSCDVFGVQNIHVVEERFPKRIDKEIAMGAQKWIDVNRYAHVDDCIHTLREKGYEIVATSPHGEAVELPDFELKRPVAIFFGTEKEGLSKEVLENANRTLKIPMVGFTESLNISVSAAIILQSLTSKLRKSDLPWQLSEEEKLELKLKWAKKSIKDSAKLLQRKFGLTP